MSQKMPEVASRLRQGSPSAIQGGALTITFNSLFKRQVDFLKSDECKLLAERSFEEYYEFPMELNPTISEPVEQKRRDDTVAVYDDTQETNFGKYQKRPTIALLQNIFKAKIRDVLSERSKPGYHLGLSCNFTTK